MKLCTFEKNDNYHLGIVTKEGIIDINSILLKESTNNNIPKTIDEIINNGDKALDQLKEYLNKLDKNIYESHLINERDIIFGPSVLNPEKIICIGLNYKRHADETNAQYPESPILFNKFNNSLTGHNKPIVIPNVTEQLDYEVELGVVIGKTIKNISKEEALESIFGYVPVNDLSARDLQMKTPQWLLGKSCDDFCPVGPYLVTRDEVENPQNLNLKTKVNGEIRQNSNTSDMIFQIDEIISYISQYMTLNPGDLILTGTPEGVVLGYPEAERVYINPGDEVTVEIESLGSLSNTFIRE